MSSLSGVCELVSDDTIWITDNFMNKTISNLRVNPRVAIYIWGPEIKGCCQIKGVASIKTSGKEFDEMKAKLNLKNPALPARSLILVKITEVFECQPGPKPACNSSDSFFCHRSRASWTYSSGDC